MSAATLPALTSSTTSTGPAIAHIPSSACPRRSLCGAPLQGHRRAGARRPLRRLPRDVGAAMTSTHTRCTPAGGGLAPDAPLNASRKAAEWETAAGPAVMTAPGPTAGRTTRGAGSRRESTSTSTAQPFNFPLPRRRNRGR
jgi:hypothetical protein